jgi:hypothetical protein
LVIMRRDGNRFGHWVAWWQRVIWVLFAGNGLGGDGMIWLRVFWK